MTALLFVLLLSTPTGCATFAKLDAKVDLKTFGQDFDDLCIAGKVKEGSAAWLNENQDQWKQHRDYTNARQPTPIRSNDRLFSGDCSEVAKQLGAGNLGAAMKALDAVAEGGQ